MITQTQRKCSFNSLDAVLKHDLDNLWRNAQLQYFSVDKYLRAEKGGGEMYVTFWWMADTEPGLCSCLPDRIDVLEYLKFRERIFGMIETSTPQDKGPAPVGEGSTSISQNLNSRSVHKKLPKLTTTPLPSLLKNSNNP
jgi:hypothetical protein